MKGMVLSLLVACLVSAMPGAQAQDCSDIRGKICSLQPFEPNPNAGGTNADSSPQCVDPTSDPITQDQKNAIQSAYDLSPSLVKAELCKVSKYFIIQSGPGHSWGRWEDPAKHTSTGGTTQIALYKDDLFGKSFSDKQDDNLVGLNLNNHAKHSPGTIPARMSSQTLGLFYTMVHELGHIIWHRDTGIGEPVTCAADPNFFTWGNLTSARNNRWTKFGDDTLGDHKNNAPKPKQVNSPDKLKLIYTGGFVTALASANPEEDFVETYSIRALMEVCPACVFNIVIGTGGNALTIKVNDDGGHPVFKEKFDCVYDNYIKAANP